MALTVYAESLPMAPMFSRLGMPYVISRRQDFETGLLLII